MQDPKLIDKPHIIKPTYDPFTKGLFVIRVPNDQIEEIGLFIQSFYNKLLEKDKGKNRQITRNALTMLQGAVFAVGTREQNNPEWKEHCASSLREMLHEWREGDLSSDYGLIFKKGNELTSDERNTLKEIKQHYQYFSGIVHHNTSTIVNTLRALLKNGLLKPEDCFKEEIFLERVKEYLRNLSQIIEYQRN